VTASDRKNIVILGSTGSIGAAALQVIEALGPQYNVSGLAANANWQLLAQQALQFKPTAVAIADQSAAQPLRDQLAHCGIEILAGPDAVCQLATRPDSDFVICAIVGAASIAAVIEAVKMKKSIALASKEALVVAGSIIIPLARRHHVPILPVDSEHSAIFQAMRAGSRREVRRILLTASGGPLRDWPLERVENATVEQALDHPTWSMGRKITIDSATMMNKALEIIEACWLFDLSPDQVEVLMHPEAIIHSMVEFADGSVIAQMSYPDMRIPIQYALTYPQRKQSLTRQLDLAEVAELTFSRPDRRRFPALDLAYQVARTGGTAPAVLNAANEAAVQAFLHEQIPFGKIVPLTAEALEKHEPIEKPSLPQILQADQWARDEVNTCLSRV